MSEQMTQHYPSPTPDEMPARQLYTRAVATFDATLRAVPVDRYTAPTACAAWDVRALVNHVVGEDRWAAELLAGRTIADVGGTLDGDLLGADPVAAWSSATTAAGRAVEATAGDALVTLSAGPTPVDEYLRQLGADHLVHAWDLAQAAGANLRLDDDLVAAIATWFAPMEQVYRSHDLIGSRPPVNDDAEPQARLLAMFGRSEALAAVDRFTEAFDARDVDAVMANMTSDCVFESTAPPNGQRHVGVEAVRAAWQRFFDEAGDHRLSAESRFAAGDRVVVQWRYEWSDGHVRGVDLFRVRGGLIAEKLSYVKG